MTEDTLLSFIRGIRAYDKFPGPLRYEIRDNAIWDTYLLRYVDGELSRLNGEEEMIQRQYAESMRKDEDGTRTN